MLEAKQFAAVQKVVGLFVAPFAGLCFFSIGYIAWTLLAAGLGIEGQGSVVFALQITPFIFLGSPMFVAFVCALGLPGLHILERMGRTGYKSAFLLGGIGGALIGLLFVFGIVSPSVQGVGLKLLSIALVWGAFVLIGGLSGLVARRAMGDPEPIVRTRRQRRRSKHVPHQNL